MKIFILLSVLAYAAAKPQYSYQQPAQPQYSAPAPQFAPQPQQQYGAPSDPQQQYTQTHTTVQKHIYVHVAPPSQEDEQVQPAPVVNHQKHYKIIFIKAPAAPQVNPAALVPQNIQEEKTLVYVLVKKPESLDEIQIPAPAPQQPSKPEVYFIKYKTQKEHVSAPAPSGPEASDPVQQPSPVYGPGH